MKGIMLYPEEVEQKSIEKLIKRLSNLNFTDIFYISKNIDGKAFYSSRFADVTEDKLNLLCKLADKYDMNINAWFCTFTEGYEGKLHGDDIGRFLKENPAYAAVEREGKNTIDNPVHCDYGLENYVCPANPGVQEYELRLMKEIAQGYPIKGLHLDFIRYPFPGDYCYCKFCRQKFYKDFGMPMDSYKSRKNLLKWKQNIINKFVNEIYTEIKKINKCIKVSALVWKYDDGPEKTQDWMEWNLDFVTPMFYHKSYGQNIEWIQREIDRNRQMSNMKIVAAIGGPFSNLFTKREWESINEIVNSSNACGILYGHYGVLDVVKALEGENKITSIKKSLMWNRLRARQILIKFLSR